MSREQIKELADDPDEGDDDSSNTKDKIVKDKAICQIYMEGADGIYVVTAPKLKDCEKTIVRLRKRTYKLNTNNALYR